MMSTFENDICRAAMKVDRIGGCVKMMFFGGMILCGMTAIALHEIKKTREAVEKLDGRVTDVEMDLDDMLDFQCCTDDVEGDK